MRVQVVLVDSKDITAQLIQHLFQVNLSLRVFLSTSLLSLTCCHAQLIGLLQVKNVLSALSHLFLKRNLVLKMHVSVFAKFGFQLPFLKELSFKCVFYLLLSVD